MIRKLVQGCLSLAIAAALGAQEPQLRLHHNTDLASGIASDSALPGATNTLMLFEQDGIRVGAERNDDGDQSFGLSYTSDMFLKDMTLYTVSASQDDSPFGEFGLNIPGLVSENTQLTFRHFLLAGKQKTALSLNYVQPGLFSNEARIGAGIEVLSGENSRAGGYLWVRPGELGNHFIGVGSYTQEERLVIGKPVRGGTAYRYLRIQNRKGFRLNEGFFTSEGENMNVVDFQAPLRGPRNNLTDSLIPGYPYRYNPPVAAGRGRDWVLHGLHVKTPVGHQLSGEAIKYIGQQFFLGGAFSYASNEKQLGLPIGTRWNGGDGLTRNLFQVQVGYDLMNKSPVVSISLETLFQ